MVPTLSCFFYPKGGLHQVGGEIAEAIERYVALLGAGVLKSSPIRSGDWKSMTAKKTRHVVAPYVVQSDVAAVAERSSSIKMQDGSVLCPAKDMRRTQWEPSSIPWAFHEAGLDHGASFEH